MREALKFIIYLFLGVAILVALFLITEKGIERYEKYECLKWRSEAWRPGYYLAQWQAEQCKARGINIDGITIK
jgi:hypothetical protein